MRFWVFLLVLLFVGFAVLKNQPAMEFARHTSDEFVSYLRDREVKISGNKLLNSEQIAAQLPKYNNVWWLLNISLIEKSLLTEPLLKNVEIKNCSFLKLNCYEVLVEEEAPAFVARQGAQPWLISAEGKFLLPLYPQAESRFTDKYPEIRISEKVANNPMLAVSQISFLSDRSEILKRISGRTVKSIEFQSDGDIKIQFADLAPTIIFNSSVLEAEGLAREINKLQFILEDLNKTGKVAAEIDLGMKERAVVRYQESA